MQKLKLLQEKEQVTKFKASPTAHRGGFSGIQFKVWLSLFLYANHIKSCPSHLHRSTRVKKLTN